VTYLRARCHFLASSVWWSRIFSLMALMKLTPAIEMREPYMDWEGEIQREPGPCLSGTADAVAKFEDCSFSTKTRDPMALVAVPPSPSPRHVPPAASRLRFPCLKYHATPRPCHLFILSNETTTQDRSSSSSFLAFLDPCNKHVKR
jgi:hypothetical protein